MKDTVTSRGPWLAPLNVERTLQVRRQVNGECSRDCDFNLGHCLMGWRHPASLIPWDRRCRDGDQYRMRRAAPASPSGGNPHA